MFMQKILSQIISTNFQQERAQRESKHFIAAASLHSKDSALHSKEEAAQMLKHLIYMEFKLSHVLYNIETILPVNLGRTT